MPNLPGTAALAALGAASIGVNYIKAGLYGLKNKEEAVFLMRNVVKAVKDCDPSIKVVATGYADAERVGSVDPMLIPLITYEAAGDVAMLDTAVKDGMNLLDFLTVDQLRLFVKDTHCFGLKAALAGSLKKENLLSLCGLGVDIVGLRGAACTGGDRVHGRITQKNVHELVQIVRSAEKQFERAV
jgi:uncharacterized protein (UPF0264 family)